MTSDDGGPMTHDPMDDHLHDLLRTARESYRVPPAADLDALWPRIEAEHFDTPRALAPVVAEALVLDATPIRRHRRGWLAPAAGLAATLLIGVGIGRFTATPIVIAPPVVGDLSPALTPTAGNVAEPLQRATYEYVARTVALLDSLPRTRSARLGGDARFVADAQQLLSTTRLLLDSPAATDPKLRALLEDLELVLAQVASLRPAPRADELTFIAEAMSERDVVPRLRTVAATYIASGY